MNLQRHPLKAATEQREEITTWQQHFESILDQFLPRANVSPGILHQAMRYSAQAGGKRFRPVLVYASGKALGLKMERLDPLACATSALTHDVKDSSFSGLAVKPRLLRRYAPGGLKHQERFATTGRAVPDRQFASTEQALN